MKSNDTRKNSTISETDSTINTRRPTPTEVAYRDGYTSGQLESDRYHRSVERAQEVNHRARENESAASGLLIGGFATLVGLGIAGYLFLPQLFRPSSQPIQVIQPTQTTPPQKVEKETKVIERTVERDRQVAPSEPPKVDVNLPKPEPTKVEVNLPKPDSQPVPTATPSTNSDGQPAN